MEPVAGAVMGNVSGITISAQLRNLERVAARAFASAAFRLSGGRCGSDPRIGQQILHEGIQFVAVGGANTVLTYGIYLGALKFVQYGWAFVAAFVAGLSFQALMKIRVVFRSRITTAKFCRYAGYAVGYFGCYFVLLRALVEVGGVRPSFAPLILLCFMTPVHFVVSRLVIAPDWVNAAGS